jgi:hypothetical protein
LELVNLWAQETMPPPPIDISVPNKPVETSSISNAVIDFATALWSLAGEVSSEFWAALAGAVVGGLIAYFIQLRAIREGRTARREEAFEADKSQAYSLFFKVLKIHNNLHHLKRHVDGCLELSAGAVRSSSYLLPLLNVPSRVEFSTAEASVLLRQKDDDVFNSVLNLDEIHNGILPAWLEYRRLREKTMLSEAETFDPETGAAQIVIKKGSLLDRAVFEASKAADELIRRSAVDFEEAEVALKGLASLLKKRFEFEFVLMPKDVGD